MEGRHVEVLSDVGMGGTEIRIRNARLQDARRIQVLYAEEYGNKYPIPTIYDREKTRQAILDKNIFWLVGEHDGKIIASLFFALDPKQKIAKAGGAVVSQLYRKHNLAQTMMRIILDKIAQEGVIEIVYGATRTVSAAPQYLTENMGFVPLGIFPNAHRVFENETHTLAAWYTDKAWKKRKAKVRILKELLPFYAIARRAVADRGFRLDEPEIITGDFSSEYRAAFPEQDIIPFEVISAENFIRHRYRTLGSSGLFKNIYVPFHEPNMMLVSHDQKTEIYIHYESFDKYCMVIGGRSEVKDFSRILNSIAFELNRNNASYIEILVDAYSPQLQWQALNARFLPSAYFPAMQRVGNMRSDCMVFSRSFDMLDFRNVTLISYYREYLKAYLKIWRDLYVNSAVGGRR
ncbi:MAG: GNAT family N-acetyltransferase [Elusimicrobiaceae bacterium]|jgi:N-acetylglutamate synthase-like GNAT family acetyltransferase